MKELTHDQITGKWGPMLKTLGIPEEHLEKISQYVHHHALLENEIAIHSPKMSTAWSMLNDVPTNTPFTSLLPVSISVLSKIKDLSKVRFVAYPKWEEDEIIKEVQVDLVKIIIPQTQAFDLMRRHGIDVIKDTEDTGIALVAKRINDLIDEGKTISFYLVISSVKVITEGAGPASVWFESRYLAEGKTLTINDL